MDDFKKAWICEDHDWWEYLDGPSRRKILRKKARLKLRRDLRLNATLCRD